jgi:hypothetical protein
LRKLLAGCLCASVATVPAVAFAATDDENDNVNVPGQTPHARELHQDAKQKLHSALRKAKRERKQELRRKRRRQLAKQQAAAPAATPTAGGSTASPQLEAIAACESGGDPGAVGGGGAYRGKYQFDYGTWASVGGSGDPAAASEAEQDQRAAMLYARSGSTPWPVCGQ